jgi:hypothetical protein
VRFVWSLLACTASAWIASHDGAHADEDLLPAEGAFFTFTRSYTDFGSGNAPATGRLELEVKSKSETGASILNHSTAVEYQTDRQQNILFYTGEGSYTAYEPYRPFYLSPLNPGSQRIDFYHFTYDKLEPKHWNDCAALIAIGPRGTFRLGNDEFDAVEVSRMNVCNESADNLQIEVERETFCLGLNFACVWTYTAYTGRPPQANFVRSQLNSEQDFELLRRKLVFFTKSFEEEDHLESAQLR